MEKEIEGLRNRLLRSSYRLIATGNPRIKTLVDSSCRTAKGTVTYKWTADSPRGKTQKKEVLSNYYCEKSKSWRFRRN